jgi:hypothetical protein
MARIRQWAAVAAFLALSAVSAPACQLSLVGPVTQQPLTYNPFQAGAATAPVSFTLRNGDGKPCNAAFAFFKPGAPQAGTAAGGAAEQSFLRVVKLQAGRCILRNNNFIHEYLS